MYEKTNQSISQLFTFVYKNVPDHESLFDPNSRMTYAELWENSISLADSLHKLGIRTGDRIAACLPNWNEFVVIYMAVAHLGAILVPINNQYHLDHLIDILRNAQVKVVFFTEEYCGVNHFTQFTAAKEQVPSLEWLFPVRSMIEGMLSYDQLVEEGNILSFTSVDIIPAEHVFMILYASGPTGTPKGTMLTHANIVNDMILSAGKIQSTTDVFFSFGRNLQTAGRKKEMNIRGGYNSHSREVEAILYMHEDVSEVAIVELPDSVLGEVSCACIKLKANAKIESQVLLNFLKERVAEHKVPDKIKIIEDFPMTLSGKIKKIALQKQLLQSMKAELY